MYTEEKERGDVSLAKRGGEEGRHNYIYIYIHIYRGWNARRDIPAPRFHEWRAP